MNDIRDLKKLIPEIEKRQNELIELYRSGKITPEDIQKFNALFFAIDSAVEKIKKGMEGEF